MARTKGALNKRTRAAFQAVKDGELDADGISSPVRYLLGVMRNTSKPDALRIEAAKSVAPYLQPKLSAVEVTNRNPADNKTEDEIFSELRTFLESNPELKAKATALFGSTLGESAATN